MRLRVVTYNILDGGTGREAHITRVLEALRPDVVVLQEVTGDTLVAALGKQFGMAHYVAPGNTWRQVALLSRLPIMAAAGHHHFPIHRAILQATLELAGGRRLHVFGIHTMALPLLAMEAWRVWEVREISQLMVPLLAEHCLLAGDFNASAPGDRVDVRGWPRWLRLMLLPQGGRVLRWAMRAVQNAGLIDCYRQLHPKADGFTLPAHAPNTRLDYIFASPSLAGRLRLCEVVGHPDEVLKASDHRPVVAEFDV